MPCNHTNKSPTGRCKSCYNKQWRRDNPERAKKQSLDNYYNHQEEALVRVHEWWKRKRADPNYQEYIMRRNLKKQYGISKEDYDQMLEAQEFKCAVCQSETPQDRWGQWQVDHDHTSGKVRGLCCVGCNGGMGLFKDDPERLRKAADYIEKHRN